MTVTLVVAEEEILAMYRIYLLPVFESLLYCRERRVCMKFIAESMLFKKAQNFSYTWVICHLLKLLA